jgi:nickel-dependent lactate racemase
VSEAASEAATVGGPGEVVDESRLREFVATALGAVDLDGRSVCVVVPDATRSCPLPMIMSAVHAAVRGRVSRLTVLVALGTHAPMPADALAGWLGYARAGLEATYPGTTVANHEWWNPQTFTSLGRIGAERIAELSGGLLHTGVDVRINRAVVEHDVALVVGPVFPHEVVGFSGGNKYFFPGVCSQEVIDVSHWLGALITSAEIIGTRGTTPVRALIDEAAARIPTERLALCLVVASGHGTPVIHSAAFGTPEQAWAAAAEVSARTHVRYLERPVRRVVSLMPPKYADIWTAAKGFYKVEPVVADAGEVILLAPHVREFSSTHPEIAEVGYHCRDYFVRQWDRFAGVHWSVLAHSTHLRGAGTFDPDAGERCRLTVTLATGIPAPVVRAANLEYRDPAALSADALAQYRADPDTLVVPDAGEVLFRLSPG